MALLDLQMLEPAEEPPHKGPKKPKSCHSKGCGPMAGSTLSLLNCP